VLPSVIVVDFVPQRSTARKVGVAMLVIGLLASAVAVTDYAHESRLRGTLESQRQSHTGTRSGTTTVVAHGTTDVALMSKALGIPWSKLLSELEAAAADRSNEVAVLGVEPDGEKRLVHILAEARSLPDALAFVRRLQSSAALRFPMLDNHETRSQDPEHPVRFRVTAEWRTGAS
jgi:hypothetical protein